MEIDNWEETTTDPDLIAWTMEKKTEEGKTVRLEAIKYEKQFGEGFEWNLTIRVYNKEEEVTHEIPYVRENNWEKEREEARKIAKDLMRTYYSPEKVMDRARRY